MLPVSVVCVTETRAYGETWRGWPGWGSPRGTLHAGDHEVLAAGHSAQFASQFTSFRMEGSTVRDVHRRQVLLAALSAAAPQFAKADDGTVLPSAEQVRRLAKGVVFSSLAVTDAPVPIEIARHNPSFRITVHYRAGPEEVAFPPPVGAIFATVHLAGVPPEHGLPDGEYFLWVGGHMHNLRAALVSINGKVLQEMEVRSKPTLTEEMKPHAAKVHAFALPGPMPNPPPPPTPRPTPRPPPTRTWREICVQPAPRNSDRPGKRWIRVPDS